ncbi:MAG: GNAT family N-acetyltransferase [Oscillospiraceae bacterium]|jgi:hypothetical protein
MIDPGLYNAFVDSAPQGSLFHKTWWLDAVAKNGYTILSIEKNGQLLAAWPITQKKTAGLKLLIQPQLTPRLGILIAPSQKARYAESLSDEMKLISGLIAKLPGHSLFCQRFSPGFSNWLPLYWAGFKQTTRYTYVLDDLSDINKLWENLRYNTKRKIKKAVSHGIKIVSDLSLDKLLDLNELTYKRQKLALPYSRDYVRQIDEACMEHGAGKKLFAVDGDGRIHAAAYIVYDKKAAYYLIGGADPGLNTFGAHYLTLWEAIKFASGVSQSFDFEGSMHRSIEPVFRSFGGIQKSYMEITGGTLLMRSAFDAFRSAWNKGGLVSKISGCLIS